MVETLGEFSSLAGRRVMFSRYGPPDGHRVLFHYGSPGTRHLGSRMAEVVERHGVQLLVLDRPGYGASTRWPGRRIADVVEDVALLVDMLGWERFAVWGGSGGGPHALACASFLADRVERCASVVGPAPYGADGLDWLEGMSAGNVEEFTRALEGEEAYRPLVERLARAAVEAARAGEVSIPADYDLPEADLAALRARLADPGHLDPTTCCALGVTRSGSCRESPAPSATSFPTATCSRPTSWMRSTAGWFSAHNNRLHMTPSTPPRRALPLESVLRLD
jgi:pimeloyl-ACP methyl ester carboxylesterase